MSDFKLYSTITIGLKDVREFRFQVEVPSGLDATAEQSYLRGVRNALLAVTHSSSQRRDTVLASIEDREILGTVVDLEATA